MIKMGGVCHNGMKHPQIADEEDGVQMWNILNKQLQTADKEWSSSLWVERRVNYSSA
jgi:hypothetical protein